MLGINKIRAIQIFAHGVLKGLYTEGPTHELTELEDPIENELNTKLCGVVDHLEKRKLTIAYLNSLPDSVNTNVTSHYYDTIADVFNVHANAKEIILEGPLGLSILSTIVTDSDYGLDITKKELYDLLAIYEAKGAINRDIVFKMHGMASEILDAVSKDKYTFIKPKRVSKTRKKKRK